MPLLMPFILLIGVLRAVWGAMKDEKFRSLLFWVVMILIGGTLFYHEVEGWAWIDAFYFTVITLTTVGYGDFAPATTLGKVFTIVYIFLGLGILLTFIDMVAARNWERFEKARPLDRLTNRFGSDEEQQEESATAR